MANAVISRTTLAEVQAAVTVLGWTVAKSRAGYTVTTPYDTYDARNLSQILDAAASYQDKLANGDQAAIEPPTVQYVTLATLDYSGPAGARQKDVQVAGPVLDSLMGRPDLFDALRTANSAYAAKVLRPVLSGFRFNRDRAALVADLRAIGHDAESASALGTDGVRPSANQAAGALMDYVRKQYGAIGRRK